MHTIYAARDVQAALSLRMLALLPTCTPQNLCNTLWAHAKVLVHARLRLCSHTLSDSAVMVQSVLCCLAPAGCKQCHG